MRCSAGRLRSAGAASKLGWRFCVQQSKFALRRAPGISRHRVRVAWEDGAFSVGCGFVRCIRTRPSSVWLEGVLLIAKGVRQGGRNEFFAKRRKEQYREREGYSEVVQRGKGLRIYPALHRWGRVRPFFCDPGKRIPHAQWRRNRGVWSAKGPQRLPGSERGPRVRLILVWPGQTSQVWNFWTFRKPSWVSGGFFAGCIPRGYSTE